MNEIQNLSPRDYQKAIFETAKQDNTLVVLPTGIGKTLISLMLTIERQKKHPNTKALILAPTRPLVEQHFQTFSSLLPELFADIQLFTGSIQAEKRKKLWQQADIILSTPQCIANDLDNLLYDLNSVSLLVIDEAHRCIRNYDYTKVVNFYKQQSQTPLILGLTASPGSDPDKVRQICSHLGIKNIEVRTRDSPDVRPYLQDREFEKIEVPFPAEFMEIKVLLQKLWDEKVSKLKSHDYLIGPANKITLLKLQTRLFQQVSQRNFAALLGLSLCAQAIKLSHALELLETQTLSGLNNYLKNLIEQAKQKKSKAVQALVKSPEFNKAHILTTNLLTKKLEHPKINELAAIVESEMKQNPNAKIMVFAQFRETVSIISQRLNQIQGIKSKIFIGQAKKPSHSEHTQGISQKEQKQIIQDFREGKINIIICTSIGEEGLDIPEVNAVIFYEPIPSAIRKIQRAGRTARLSPGKLIILVTQGTRDEIHHYASSARERKMYRTIELIKNEIKNRSKNPTLTNFSSPTTWSNNTETKSYKP